MQWEEVHIADLAMLGVEMAGEVLWIMMYLLTIADGYGSERRSIKPPPNLMQSSCAALTARLQGY